MKQAQNFRLGLAQMTSTDQVDSNLETVERLYLTAADERADLLVFPENTLYFRIQAALPITGIKWQGVEMQRLQRLVEAQSTALMLTTPVEDEDHKLRNTTLLFQGGKAPERLYTKIHLFDVDVAGAPAVRESDSFTAGTSPRVVELKGWKFGMSICYDLRFSELYRGYAQKVDVILVPAAFLVPTGEAHWHILLRARAIENQCFVAAAAQSGEHRSGGQSRKTFGHSLLIDPWGKILSELQESPEIRVVELSREQIVKTRQQIPMDSHRRL